MYDDIVFVDWPDIVRKDEILGIFFVFEFGDFLVRNEVPIFLENSKSFIYSIKRAIRLLFSVGMFYETTF